MNRFLKALSLLVVALLLLASGVNATLDRLERVPAQNSVTWYDGKGGALLAYNGDLSQCKILARPVHASAPSFFHRTAGDIRLTGENSGARERWF